MNNKTYECLQKINDLIECLKNDIFRSKTKLEKEMDEKTLECLYYLQDVFNESSVSYPNVGRFQEIMQLLEIFLETLSLSDYDKGKIIRKFLLIPFDSKSSEVLSINYTEAFNFLNINRKISSQRVQNSIIKYINNPNTLELKADLKDDIRNFLNKTKEYDMAFKNRYVEFQKKYLNVDINSSFVNLKSELQSLGLSDSMSNYYCVYCNCLYEKKQKEQKTFVTKKTIVETKNENPYSKKELKKRLLKYCDLLKDKQFDYENYDEVLSLLSYLELADSVNTKYFNYCFQNRITNASYYKLLLTKIKNNKKYEDEISLINWYLESIKSEEDKNAAMESIYEILKTIPELEMLNFDYEYETMKRVRGGKNG